MSAELETRIVIKCSERQIKSGFRDLSKFASESGLNYDFTHDIDQDNNLIIHAKVPPEDISLLVQTVQDKYKKRFDKLEILSSKGTRRQQTSPQSTVSQVAEVESEVKVQTEHNIIQDVNPIPSTQEVPLKLRVRKSRRRSSRRAKYY